MKPWIDLKGLRKERGWTQKEAAKELQFCRSYIAAVESKRQGISIEMMNAIIRVFGIRYEDFYKNRL